MARQRIVISHVQRPGEVDDDGSFDLEFWRQVGVEGRLQRLGSWSRGSRPSGGTTGINPNFRNLLFDLNAAEARYLGVGAHPAICCASLRHTKDLDLWVDLSRENARRVCAVLARFGARPHNLTVSDRSTPSTVFQIGVEPNRIDVLTLIEGLTFAEAWKQRVTCIPPGC